MSLTSYRAAPPRIIFVAVACQIMRLTSLDRSLERLGDVLKVRRAAPPRNRHSPDSCIWLLDIKKRLHLSSIKASKDKAVCPDIFRTMKEVFIKKRNSDCSTL